MRWVYLYYNFHILLHFSVSKNQYQCMTSILTEPFWFVLRCCCRHDALCVKSESAE